jgi:antirestriction protein ArdC
MDVYARVKDQIVAALETAQKWQRPWITAFAPSGNGLLQRPVNGITRAPYRGINVPILWSAGRASPYWATYRAWQSAGAQVRKGERGTLVVFWKQMARRSDETSDDGEAGEERRDTYWLARGYVVFNGEQVDDWEPPQPPTPCAPAAHPFAPIPEAEDFVANTGAIVRHGGDRAFYTPSADFIRMPERRQFVGSSTSSPAEAYYGTLFHELTHWSGAKSRCDRDLSGRFGDEAYAAEELVAELGAAFLCADHLLRFEPRSDHAAYVASWLKVLKNDKRAIFTAASKAEQACRFLSGLQQSMARVA